MNIFYKKNSKAGGHEKKSGVLLRASMPLFFIALLLFAVSLFGLAYSYKLLVDGRLDLLNAISVARFEQEKKGKSDQIRLLLRGNEDSLAALDDYFVRSANIVPFLEKMELLDISLPVSPKLSSVSLSAARDSLSASISANGSFVEAYRFLLAIESLPYKVVVDDVQLSFGQLARAGSFVGNIKDSKEGGSWTVSASLLVKSVLPERK